MLTRAAAIIIRSVAAWIVVAGAGASLVFMLHAARRQQSRLLLLLFGLWVLSPFLAALVAGWVSRRWSSAIQRAVDVLMVLLALASCVIYGTVAFGNLSVKIGFIFLIVPLASWAFMLLAFGTAALISSRHRSRGGQV
jgi:hypothetical protein